MGSPADGLSGLSDVPPPAETGVAPGARSVAPPGEPGRPPREHAPTLPGPITEPTTAHREASLPPAVVLPAARRSVDVAHVDALFTSARGPDVTAPRDPRHQAPSSRAARGEPLDHAPAMARRSGQERKTASASVPARHHAQPIPVTSGAEPPPVQGRGDVGHRLFVREDSARLVPAQDRQADARRRDPARREPVGAGPAPSDSSAVWPGRQSAEAPVIEVTIGRVEIRATVASSQDKKRAPRAPALGLDAYLRQRSGGRS